MLLLGSGLVAQSPGKPSFLPLPKPDLIIGTEGDPDYEFVNIVAIYRLPDGAIAVGDYQSKTPTLRIYDPKGRLLRRLGRQGEGPGEFRALNRLFLVGDTLIAFDSNLLRLTRYLPGGALVGTQPVRGSPEEGRAYIAARLPSGRWLVTTQLNAPSWEHGHGMYRDTIRVGTMDASSNGRARWAGRVGGITFFAYMPSDDKSRWRVGPALVAPIPQVRSIADTIILGDTAIPELQYLHPDGRTIRRLTLPLGDPPDLRRRRAIARDEGFAMDPSGGNRAYVQAMYDAPLPAPRYRTLLVASNGDLWIRLYDQDPDDLTRYLIVSPAGAVRARVSLPARSEIMSVRAPWITVVLKDADDVERAGLIRWETP